MYIPSPDTFETATIFVQIASYRDSECQHTVRDLFEKAAFPDRINVGICWQFDPEEDEHCFQIVTRPDQVSLYPCHWKESLGISWARNKVQSLWEGEDYILMIDSHMRFIDNWDVELLKELAKCPAKKPLISCSPAAYTPPNALEPNPMPTIRRSGFFDDGGGIRFRGMYLNEKPETPLPAAFVAGGFMFCSGRFVQELPYDPFMYFNNEEAYIAVRMFTHGWDIFSPTKQFTYHYYRTEEQTDRPLIFKDRNMARFANLGQQRFDHILGCRTSTDPEVIQEVEKYGLGHERTLEEYAAFSGVNYANKTICEDRALRCGFVPELKRYIRAIVVPEIDKGPLNPKYQKQLVAYEEVTQGLAGKGEKIDLKTIPDYDTRPTPPQRQPDYKPSATAIASAYLQPGACIPFFTLPDHDGKPRELQLYGGKQVQLYFLPQQRDAIADFFDAMKAYDAQAKALDCYQIFLVPFSPEETAQLRKDLNLAQHLWVDPKQTIAKALGIDHQTQLHALALSPNLRLQQAFHSEDASTCISEVFACQKAQKPQTTPAVMTRHAPVLQIPQALTPELCEELQAYWRKHEQHEGQVGGGNDTRVQKGAKIRTDCFIKDDSLLRKIDERLCMAVFPEIEKVYGLEVTRREEHKVGCYKAEEEGFFTMHRDNFTEALSYRRLAMSLVLNDSYEGGHICFPEYTQDLYRCNGGDAVVFPCSLVHQVTPVTSGARFVMLTFLYGEAQAEHRATYKQREHQVNAPKEEWKVLQPKTGEQPWDDISRYDNLPRRLWKISYNG